MLPNFMDIFTWSIPFVSEKVTEMLAEMIKHVDAIDDDGNAPEVEKRDVEVLRKKIKFISKMAKM